MKTFQTAGLAAVLATLAAAGPAWAQTCTYDLTTVAVPPPANVPSLSMLGVALLAAAVGFLAWRQGRFPGARFMAIALVAAAAMLANQGGGGLVQQAYAAVVEVLLNNPDGQTVSASAEDGDEVIFRNSTQVPLRISSITPAPAACGEGTVIPPGGVCSTTASCFRGCQGRDQIENPRYPIFNNIPQQRCICGPGYARDDNGDCVEEGACNSVFTQPDGERICQ